MVIVLVGEKEIVIVAEREIEVVLVLLGVLENDLGVLLVLGLGVGDKPRAVMTY